MIGNAHPLLPRGMAVLERGWLSSNSIVLSGPADAAVIDSGYWTHSEQTVALVAAAAGPRSVNTLVNTHLHSDHCGGNAALQDRFCGLQTYVPPGLAQAVRDWDPAALTYEPTGQHCPQFRLDGVLVPGTRMQLGGLLWEVHGAPGHDPHSVVFFEPGSRVLVSADALWENGFGVVFQELEGDDAFNEVAATLDLIETLRPLVVVPGHGSVFEDVESALQRARSRLDAYLAHPVRHARHAAKVLMKFKLLEVRRARTSDFLAWAEATRYLELVRLRWFPDAPAAEWISQLLDDLVRSGAAARDREFVEDA